MKHRGRRSTTASPARTTAGRLLRGRFLRISHAYPRCTCDHSQNNGGCAITGNAFTCLALTNFRRPTPAHYFFADLCRGWIRKLDPSTKNQAVTFATGINLPSISRSGTDGALYYLSPRRWIGGSRHVDGLRRFVDACVRQQNGQNFALRARTPIWRWQPRNARGVVQCANGIVEPPNSCLRVNYETSTGRVPLNDAATAFTSKGCAAATPSSEQPVRLSWRRRR